MSEWGFGDPRGPGDIFETKDNVGRLVAFVEGKRTTVDTKFGEQEATQCRYVVVLDGDDAGTVYDDPIVFGNLSKDAADPENKIVLGRISMGDAKPGRNAPYILQAATDEDKKLAGEWFDKNAAINSVGSVLIG
jgi:hypothetical protein